ncbi:MAG: T9SS type A sorting domain-containing protein [Bacteroidales bacterium]|nr:T9SS type A sorting domain-containing protein [Bacteroidales bacterium]
MEGMNSDAQVILTDINGRTISVQTLAQGQQTMTINTENLASGVYYVRVISGTMTRTQKLIKK